MEETFTYRPMAVSDLSIVLDLLSATFCNEPLEAIAGISYQDFRDMVSFEITPILSQGFCQVVQNQDGIIIATLIANDVCAERSSATSSCPSCENYLPISAMINSLYQQHVAPLAQRSGQLLYVFIACVSPDYQRRGILKTLIRRSQAQARQNGYLRITTITTSPASQRPIMQLGYEIIGQINYCDFEYQGKRPFSELGHLGGATVLEWDCSKSG
ncbi:GNAT family N-acetyltransferase [Thalassospira mesophila]|uniref:N-acetyltransferase domain-containing protein n=1 Tax=Thalassospira mesophila TaxID=1293891 RepID=A0A1Y2KWK9_9PROT|nr:GNAT family N-acetyltransferase [Thalassospira mesophila]OSQ36018.1 hypothetical protein TMES_19595 [Thalassospira mesophila]